jgi:hypothetical protein
MNNTRPNVPFGTGGEYIFNFCNLHRLQLRAEHYKIPAQQQALAVSGKCEKNSKDLNLNVNLK